VISEFEKESAPRHSGAYPHWASIFDVSILWTNSQGSRKCCYRAQRLAGCCLPGRPVTPSTTSSTINGKTIATTITDRIFGLEIARRAELAALERAEQSGNHVAVAINRKRLDAATKRLEEAASSVGPIELSDEAVKALIANSSKVF
jgi:hypothetical protein